MKRIGIISDTHGTFDQKMRDFLKDVDFVWCAGDIGNEQTANLLAGFKPMYAVWGNIDDYTVRGMYNEFQCFECEDKRVMITHIGFQGRHYTARTAQMVEKFKPDIVVSGHSHILKIFYDQKLDILNINPGAAGAYGFHRIRTAVRLEIDGRNVRNLEIAEWPR